MPSWPPWKDSGSVGGRTGWTPRHLVLKDDCGGVAGARARAISSRTARASTCSTMPGPTPMQRAGGDYYPKLQIAVPFTPVTGRRLLVRPARRGRTERALAARGRRAAVRAARASSVARHVPRPRPVGAARPARLPAAHRPAVPLGQRGLRDLRGLPRRARLAQAQGRSARSGARRSAAASTVEHADRPRHHRGALGRVLRLLHGHRLAQMGPALPQPRAFFSLLGERMAERVLLVMARRGGRPIAGALNFIGADALYGRYWGCRRGAPVPAFRGLLLPGHRLRHRARPAARRGRRAGRAQAGARLPARPRPIPRTTSLTRAAPRHRRLSRARARIRRGGGRAVERTRSLSQDDEHRRRRDDREIRLSSRLGLAHFQVGTLVMRRHLSA